MENNLTGDYTSALQQFFVTSLREMYWGENHLVNVLGTMAESASEEELVAAFDQHKMQTQEHVSTLEQIFTLLQTNSDPLFSVGLQGLFDEGWQVIDETESGSAQRDVALIIAAQKVEHYEIATYGSLITLANTLGERKIASMLFSILEEEKETDGLLTRIAETNTNQRAKEEVFSQ